jgi:hypothetical protein
MPSSTLAATIQFQVGAQMIMKGTGSPMTQPKTNTCLRPRLSASCPDTRLVNAFVTPKLMINEATTVVDVILNSSDPISGTTVRSSPTMPPTKALTNTSSENWGRFSRSPKRTGDCDLIFPESAIVHTVWFFPVESTRADAAMQMLRQQVSVSNCN